MTRERLPNRRPALTLAIEHEGFRCAVTVGFHLDGRVGEVFVSNLKSGSAIDALVADAAVAISRLFQHGATPADLACSMGRLGDDAPASLIGAAIDAAAQIQCEIGP